MHPSGVQFGLSRGLLQLRGAEVLLSDGVMEGLAIEAQLWVQLRRPPIEGNFLVNMTVRAAEFMLTNQDRGTRQEIVSFFASLNRTMYYTLARVAERAGLAHKEPRRLMTNEDFWGEFCERAMDLKIKPGSHVGKIQKALFKVCVEIVRKRYAQNDPDNVRYAELIALFMFNFWNATGLLPMSQAMVILGMNL